MQRWGLDKIYEVPGIRPALVISGAAEQTPSVESRCSGSDWSDR